MYIEKWVYRCFECNKYYDSIEFEMPDSIRTSNSKIYKNDNGKPVLEKIIEGVCNNCSPMDEIRERWKKVFPNSNKK